MADSNLPQLGNGLSPFAYEQLTVTNAEKKLTVATFQPSNEAPAKAALVQVESQPCRYRGDGTAADASTGHLLAATDTHVLTSTDAIVNASFFRSGGVDATINVHYYR